jgi:hypothetical protein
MSPMLNQWFVAGVELGQVDSSIGAELVEQRAFVLFALS